MLLEGTTFCPSASIRIMNKDEKVMSCNSQEKTVHFFYIYNIYFPLNKFL